MRYVKGTIGRIQEEKNNWGKAQTDSWIEEKLAKLKEEYPDLWQFIAGTQREVFCYICPEERAESLKGACPAEMVQRYLLGKLLELVEAFSASAEIEQLQRLWKE